MTALNFCDPGSRGSSTGSSKIHNCYLQKALCHKGFRSLGSRGSSTRKCCYLYCYPLLPGDYRRKEAKRLWQSTQLSGN